MQVSWLIADEIDWMDLVSEWLWIWFCWVVLMLIINWEIGSVKLEIYLNIGEVMGSNLKERRKCKNIFI